MNLKPLATSTPDTKSYRLTGHEDSNLPEGWSRKEVTRQSGNSQGKTDFYYISPNGKQVRSKVELAKLLHEPTYLPMKKKRDRPKKQKIENNFPTKCHRSCGEICLKLPESLYKLPGAILWQLTANPINTLKQLEIACGFENALTKTLIKTLVKATSLKEITIDGIYSGTFSKVSDEMAGVLSKCTKIKLKQFKESPEFWEKCMAAAGNNCKAFTTIDCNGLGTVVSMLPALFPRLISLTLINPDLNDFHYVRTNQLFCSFFQKMVSKKSKLGFLTLDRLWDLLCDVPPHILLSVLKPLTSFSLCRTSLNLPQIFPLVRLWARTPLSSLALETDWGCWNQVPYHLLLPSITRISRLSLKGTDLSGEVLQGLLSALAEGCAVKELDVRGNDMSHIGVDVVVAAVTRLRVAVLTHCNLSMEAVEAVLEVLAGGDKGELEEMDLTRSHENFEKMNKEDELVKKAKKGAGIRRLEIHGKRCKCDSYCKWHMM